jgi:hypothetical protein
MFWSFASICQDCLLLNGSLFYLAYGLIVLAASLTPFNNVRQNIEKSIAALPPFPGELGKLRTLRTYPKPRASIGALLLTAILGFASFKFFQCVITGVLNFIRTVLLMRDNPTFFTSFRRYLVLYLVIVPLPAAFMAPVAYAQRKPDFQLLSAVVLLICINALGDAVSIRVTLHNFENLKFEKTSIDDSSAENFWAGVRNEALYYFAVVKGTLLSLAVLVAVLACSSVLYGVQIGHLNFAFTTAFLEGAWERVLQFPGLAFEMYWFRGEPGPFGLSGIPGIFLYGLTTFLPIIGLFFLAVLWLILLPFRIAVNLPATLPLRIVSSEFAVFFVCVVASQVLKINVLGLYSFLMHTWTTW